MKCDVDQNCLARFWTFLSHLDGLVSMKPLEKNRIWHRTYPFLSFCRVYFFVVDDLTSLSTCCRQLGVALIRGLESNPHTASCMKHCIAYYKPASGHDRDNVQVSDYELLNYFAPSFIAAIKEAGECD